MHRSLILSLVLMVGARAGSPNLYRPYPQVVNITEGTSWPAGQALPTFATPAPTLDTIVVEDLSKDEQITFSALQGLVNRKQPRIMLLDARAEEGSETWATTATVGLGPLNRIDHDHKWDLVAKYAGELTGVVLYEPKVNLHYRNLAGTVAGLRHALPVTPEAYAALKEKGVMLSVVEDLTGFTFTKPTEIYGYLYDHYWKDCDKRLIVSARPNDERGSGDYHHTRDIAVACGAAVVWLDTLVPEERNLLRKFFGDMKAGHAIALGWYRTERSGIPTATEFGIGTMPADFFMSGSVFAGSDHHIYIPAVPKMPALENKAFIAIFMSDGDNIQYTQHAMRKIWDRMASSRGKMPINWTIAPGLVDVAPGIMNYYYGTATPNDCFVTGPSGMGYLMPYNTLREFGATLGDNLTDPARMDGYASLTETYLQRSGLRVSTIWDDATPMQRNGYEKNCRNLYGATVQNFKDVPAVVGSDVNNRIHFDKLVVPYAGSYDHISGSLIKEIEAWDGKAPLFLSYQVTAWGEMKPDKLMQLHDNLNTRFPDKIEFARADHYFNLYNEAKGLPFNLCLLPATTIRSGDPSAKAAAAADGTPVTAWEVSEKKNQWLGFDFGKPYRLNRYVIRHAGVNGMKRDLNTRAFAVQASVDGKSWKTLDVVKANGADVTDVEFPATSARYAKIVIADAGTDAIARIADVEFYGSN